MIIFVCIFSLANIMHVSYTVFNIYSIIRNRTFPTKMCRGSIKDVDLFQISVAGCLLAQSGLAWQGARCLLFPVTVQVAPDKTSSQMPKLSK